MPPVCASRRACEPCRNAKRKCGGQLPSCARCQDRGITCRYAQSLRMGRPRKNINVATLPSQPPQAANSVFDSTAPSTSEAPPTSDPMPMTLSSSRTNATELQDMILLEQSISSFGEAGYDFGISFKSMLGCRDSTIVPGDHTLASLTHPLCHLSVTPTCACLATLYLLLDDMRNMNRTASLEDLEQLHGITQKAAGIVSCPICPSRYITLLQNVSLLCTVLFSIAKAYGDIVTTIDNWPAPDASHIYSGNYQDIHEESSSNALCSEGHDWVPIPSVDWRDEAKSLVRSKIWGQLANHHSFSSLLDMFETRQVRWHASPPCADFPASHIHGTEKRPGCVVQCHQVRQLLRVTGVHD